MVFLCPVYIFPSTKSWCQVHMGKYAEIGVFPQPLRERTGEFPHVAITNSCEFPHGYIQWERCISTTSFHGNTLEVVEFHMWKYTGIGVFPQPLSERTSEFPHVEIHHLLWISTWGYSRGSVYFHHFFSRKYTNTREFPHGDIQGDRCISATNFRGNTLEVVEFHMWKYTGIGVFPQPLSERTSEFPHVEIHQHVCKSTCGITRGFAYFRPWAQRD